MPGAYKAVSGVKYFCSSLRFGFSITDISFFFLLDLKYH